MLHNNSFRGHQIFSSRGNQYEELFAAVYSEAEKTTNSGIAFCLEITDGDGSSIIYYGSEAARQLVSSLEKSVNSILKNGSTEEKFNLREISKFMQAGLYKLEDAIHNIAALDATNRKSEVGYILSFHRRESSPRPPSHR